MNNFICGLLWPIRRVLYCWLLGDHYWVDLSTDPDHLRLRCNDCGAEFLHYRMTIKVKREQG
jgi:hypothetical protein